MCSLTAADSSRSELRHIIAMTVPVVLTTSSRALMDVADYVMITFLREPEAQAAILPAQVLMWSYIVLGMALASMVNTFASQSQGRGRPAEASAYGWQSLYLAAAFALLSVLVLPIMGPLVRVIGHDAGVQARELAYLDIALHTTGPTIAANGLAWFFIAVRRPWVAMWSAMEANVVNIVVSAVLMFGLLGNEPMGIAGAAWGTLAAVCYRTLRLILTLLAPACARAFSSRTTWRPSWARMRDLIRVGLPFALQTVSEVIVWAIFVNVLVGRTFGTAHLIATNAAWQYMRIAFLPSMGVGQALTALVGNSIGAGDRGRARRETFVATLITVGYMGSLSVIYALFGGELIGLFNSDPEVMRIGRGVMICAAVFQLFDAMSITYSAALRGAGDTFVPSIVFTISNWVVIVGGGWCAATYYPEWGSIGPWAASAALFFFAAMYFLWRWRCGAWEKIELFRDAAPCADTAGAVTVPVAEL